MAHFLGLQSSRSRQQWCILGSTSLAFHLLPTLCELKGTQIMKQLILLKTKLNLYACLCMHAHPVPSSTDFHEVPSIHINALALVGAGKENLLLKVRVCIGADVRKVELLGQAECSLSQLFIHLLNKYLLIFCIRSQTMCPCMFISSPEPAFFLLSIGPLASLSLVFPDLRNSIS